MKNAIAVSTNDLSEACPSITDILSAALQSMTKTRAPDPQHQTIEMCDDGSYRIKSEIVPGAEGNARLQFDAALKLQYGRVHIQILNGPVRRMKVVMEEGEMKFLNDDDQSNIF